MVFTISKQWIRKEIPNSILAQSLEEEPNAMEIIIPNEVIIPEVMAFLENLSNGRLSLFDPQSMLKAHRYLNIPEILRPLRNIIPEFRV